MLNCQHTLLQHEGLLHITGPDTLTFLQGQTTCDTRAVNSDQAAAGVYCTPKGRVVCDFLLCPLNAEDAYVMRMRKSIIPNAAQVFGKYIVFSKADLDDTGSQWQLAGLWGPEALEAVHDTFGVEPTGQYGAVTGPGFTVVQLDSEGLRFECYIDTSIAADRVSSLQKTSQATDESLWQSLDIAAGVARIDTGLVEEYVPQTLNYDLTGHISFTKGCYTGQEVVARLHYRGTPKRRCFIAQLEISEPPMNGAELFATTAKGSVGNLINPVFIDGNVVALAAATFDGAESGLHLESLEGPALKLQDLPYALSAEEE